MSWDDAVEIDLAVQFCPDWAPSVHQILNAWSKAANGHEIPTGVGPHQALCITILNDMDDGVIYTSSGTIIGPEQVVSGLSELGGESISIAGMWGVHVIRTLLDRVYPFLVSLDGECGANGASYTFGIYNERLWVAEPAAIRPADHRTSPEMLQTLVKLGDHAIWDQVVRNPACPPDVLVCLLAGDDAAVRQMALEHSNLPEEYRQLQKVAH